MKKKFLQKNFLHNIKSFIIFKFTYIFSISIIKSFWKILVQKTISWFLYYTAKNCKNLRDPTISRENKHKLYPHCIQVCFKVSQILWECIFLISLATSTFLKIVNNVYFGILTLFQWFWFLWKRLWLVKYVVYRNCNTRIAFKFIKFMVEWLLEKKEMKKFY